MTITNIRFHAKTLSLVFLMTVFLSGCVTTVTGGSNREKDPERALASHVQLGLNYLRVKNRESARFHLEKALKLDKKSPAANDGMALLYQLDGEMDLAEKYFKAAIKADSDFSRAHNNYGSFLYQKERYEEAFAEFEKASNDLGYDARPTALVNLGRTALKLNDVDRAEAAFSHSLSLAPNNPPAIVESAEIAFNKQDYAEAKRLIDLYGKMVRHSPRTLWLGIRLEQIFGNSDKEASYALQLKSLHPYSKEYLEYKQSLESQ